MELSIDESDERLSRLDWSMDERLQVLEASRKSRLANSHHLPKRLQEISIRERGYKNTAEIP